jgi:4-amino-4-deoxy-L-arabinose transferase-like glycosyltransferase
VNRQSTFLVFLFALTVFRIAYSGWFELSLDEAYYWVWSRSLDFSYYDHPPMVAYMIALANLFGESESFTRAPAVLCGTGVTWIIYLLASDIFGSRKTGFLTALLLNITLIFGVGSLMITPDAPLALFWMLTLYFGYKIVDTQKPVYWWALGLSFGLALLSKYNAALFAPAFLVFLVISKENRHWLFRPEPYLAFTLSILVFTPVIYWNWAHDWVSFGFQLSHGLNPDSRGAIANAAEFWGGQAALYGLFLFFFIIASCVGLGRLGIKLKRDDFLYLSVISLSLFAFFFLNSFMKRMEGNWAVIAYFSAIAATPGFIALWADRAVAVKRKWVLLGYRASALVAVLLTVYAHIQIIEPVLPMPQKHEISRRIYGWRMLAAETDKLLKPLNDGAFIIANRYQISTLLTYYTAGHVDSYITNGKGRFGYFGSVKRLVGEDAVYVTETGRSDLPRISGFFEKTEPAGKLRIIRQGELIREFKFYKCFNYKGGLIEI